MDIHTTSSQKYDFFFFLKKSLMLKAALNKQYSKSVILQSITKM